MRCRGRASRQCGAALLTAMLTVTLVATLAAAALWQQWRSVEVEAAERVRVQASWLLLGAQDWARLILREDARSGGADHLGEPWAVPLQEARLSSFLSADQDADLDRDAFLSGQVIDLQSRLNVQNLLDNRKLSEPDVKAFGRLFDLLGLPPQELSTLTARLLIASEGGTAASAQDAPLMPQRVEQLAWLGLSTRTLAVLEPYITLLPLRTAVNLNTAGPEVIFASLSDVDMASVQRLVQQRSLTHFEQLDAAARALGLTTPLLEGRHSIASRFFEVRGQLRLDQSVVQERAVLQRSGLEVRTLWRERGVLPPPPARPS